MRLLLLFLMLLQGVHMEYVQRGLAIRPYPAVEEVYAAAVPDYNPSRIHWTIHCKKRGGRYKKRYC